ncbi:hypothetical protein P8452_61068 [Trifolium repens]|nr:hypothetical protein P8452_61068 [Trifolium repens]
MKLIAVLLIVVFTTFTTSDPDNLQDICVADLASAIIVNGFPCKPATTVTAADFSSKILATPGATTNTTFGSSVTAANVLRIPGLNTLGVSLARIDFAPGGINPPHSHPRATEILFVLEVISAFNSQLQGTVNIALTLFAATPPVADQVLAQTFKATIPQVQTVKARFAP